MVQINNIIKEILILLPLISGLLTGSYNSLLKSISIKKYSSATYLFIVFTMLSLISFPLIFFHPQFPTQILPWAIFSFVIVFYAIANYFLIQAYKFEDVSNVELITKVSLVLTFIIGTIFLSENVSFFKIIGVFFIIAGIVVIFKEKKQIQIKNVKGLLYALITGLGYTVAVTASKFALRSFSPFTFMFSTYFFLALTFIFFPKVKNESKELLLKFKYKFILIGVIGVVAYSTFLESLKYLNLSFSYILIGSTTTLTSVGIGIILLKDRKNILNKIIGLLLTILGIVLFYR